MIIINGCLIVAIIYIIVKLVVLLKQKTAFFLMILLSFGQHILSIIYLNSGVFVNELGVTTYNVPKSTALFLLYTFIFFLFIYYYSKRNKLNRFDRTVIQQSNSLSEYFTKLSIYVTLLLEIYILIDLIISGIPLGSSFMTYYNYYTMYSTLPMASTVNNWMGLCAFWLGFFYARNKNSRKYKIICYIEMIIMLILRVLLDGKMSSIIDTLIAFVSSSIILKNINLRKIKDIMKFKYIILALILLATIVGFYAFNVIKNNRAENLSAAIELFSNRAFGLGNHMWWAAEADRIHGNDFFGRNAVAEILSVLEGKNEFDIDTGTYYMMRKYGNSYIVNVDIEHGIRYAATFITTTVHSFGYIFSLPIIAVIAWITVIFVKNIYKCVSKGQVIHFIFIIKVWGSFSQYIRSTGTLTTWLNPENYIYMLIIIFLFAQKRKVLFRKLY